MPHGQQQFTSTASDVTNDPEIGTADRTTPSTTTKWAAP